MESPYFKLLVLKASAPEVTRKFYQALGFEFIGEKHGNGPFHFSGALGAGVLEIYPVADGSVANSDLHLGFTVQNLQRILDALRLIETPIRSAPKETKWGLRAVVEDPDGRVVEIYQEPGGPPQHPDSSPPSLS